MRWTVVGFNHPSEKKSVIYKQNLPTEQHLYIAIQEGIDKGCNLFSVRGFPEDKDKTVK